MSRKKKPDAPTDPTRRRLLAGAPLAGAAAVAAVATEPGVEEAEAQPPDPRQPAYRLTEHVKAYYARARG